MNIFEYNYLIWFLVGLIFFILELSAPGFIVFFFGLGSWIVAVVLGLFKLNLNLNEQIILFILSSVFLLIILRKYLKDIFYGGQSVESSEKKSISENINAIVSKKIKPNEFGEIKFKGTFYKAKSNETIDIGVTVEVINYEKTNNNFLEVKKIKGD